MIWQQVILFSYLCPSLKIFLTGETERTCPKFRSGGIRRAGILWDEVRNAMNMKKIIATENAPKAVGPYSQAVEVNGTVWISGQIPVNPADGSIPDTIEEQSAQALKNVVAILAEAGLSCADVVKTTVLLADMADFKAMNAVYAEYFTDRMPARACFQVAALPLGVKIEIEAVAVR